MGQNLRWKNLTEDLCAFGVIKSSQQKVGSQRQEALASLDYPWMVWGAALEQVSAIPQMPTRPFSLQFQSQEGKGNP